MYLSRVEITDIRCFKEVVIDFNGSGGFKKWLLILGDNGTGKTTLLRSIAMGLCNETATSGLAEELYGDFIRAGSPQGTIKITLSGGRSFAKELSIETTIKRTDYGYKVVQKTEPEVEFPWKSIFVCGYGAARRKYETRDHSEYASLESVYTLFNYDAPLQNPELVLARLNYPEVGVDVEKTVFPLIEGILMLSPGSIRRTKEGLELSGPWGKFVPIGALGDGYQGTLAWICDLLGWALFFDQSMLKDHLEGIVLIDEIEQHLHPSWQKLMIRLLSQQFPKIQFIGTSHSPLTAIGTTELSDDECQLMLLLQKESFIDAISKLKPPREKRADQVLTSYLFGLTTSGDDVVRRDIERFSKLVSKARSKEEEKELMTLQARLERILGQPETELERKVATAVKEVLEKEPDLTTMKKQVIDYEVKRQLKVLVGEEIDL